MGHYGGFADRVRVDRRFASPLPESIATHTAAPLMGAGVTVFSPPCRHAAAGSRVAVIGI